jgi:hypothetical protein
VLAQFAGISLRVNIGSLAWLSCTGPYARSATFAPVADRAQLAQQKNRPLTSIPWPTTLHWQCSQTGAIAWIAHSKLSKVCHSPDPATT